MQKQDSQMHRRAELAQREKTLTLTLTLTRVVLQLAHDPSMRTELGEP